MLFVGAAMSSSLCTRFENLYRRYAVGVINDIDDSIREEDIKKSFPIFKARFSKIKAYERSQFAAFKILGYDSSIVDLFSCHSSDRSASIISYVIESR